ncbi:unnamed protein product, partial [marine sediment metagenome]
MNKDQKDIEIRLLSMKEGISWQEAKKIINKRNRRL